MKKNLVNSFMLKFILFRLIKLISLGLIFSAYFLINLNAQSEVRFTTKDYRVQVKPLFRNLDKPWGFDFLPEGRIGRGRIILNEKNGNVLLLDPKTKQKKKLITIKQVKEIGQGGLMDVLVHPRFTSGKPYIYFSLTIENKQGRGYATLLVRYEFKNDSLINPKVLFQGRPFSSSGRHFGSRIRIDKDNYLYLALGERGNRPQSQDLKTHYGKVIRLHDDGRIPRDNPFIGKNALPEIFTYGHRNPQGLALHPQSDAVWTSEHGARGGDEINLLGAGRNYGWPVISYGRHYVGTKIGEGTAKAGLEQPVFYWDPSIAPAGMTFYQGPLFPKWQNSLFVTSLKFGFLSRLELRGDKVVGEERIFRNEFGRIRDVKESPSGTIMFITDESRGGLYEITRG